MPGHLEGKSIVITGAGRGLGRAFAIDAATEGAQVVVNDRDELEAISVAAEITASGGIAISNGGSVTEWDDVTRLIKQCIDEFGTLDGLVNNAGIFQWRAPWDENPEDLRAILEVNVLGAMFCGIQALSAMCDRRKGSIVNIVSGAHLGIPSQSSYGGTKGALTSLTYAWAIDSRAFGIRVNGVSPRAETRMSAIPGDRPSDVRAADPSSIAPLVTYLLSDRSRQLSGQVIRLDGQALSVLRQPRFPVDPMVADSWSFESIGTAFEGALGDTVNDVGLRPVSLRDQGGASLT